MKILINSQPLEFTLEEESSVGEVADGVTRWLDPAGLVITAGRLAASGTSRSLEDKEQWGEVSLDGVEELDFTVEDYRTMQINHLRTMHEYFRLLASNLAESSANPDVDAAIGQLPDLLEGLRAIIGHRHMNAVGSQLADLQSWLRDATARRANDESLAAHELGGVADRLASLDDIVVQIERELSDPASALARQLAELRSCSESIEQVAVWLQSGDDRKAMDTVATLTDYTQQVMRGVATIRRLRSAQAVIDDGPAQSSATRQPDEEPTIAGKAQSEFYQELNGYLREIAAAFEDVDAVLIGDLLEYEVAPRLESLASFAEPYAATR